RGRGLRESFPSGGRPCQVLDRPRAVHSVHPDHPEPGGAYLLMETILEGRVRGNGRSRLHLAPEGLALTSVPDGDVKYASYDEVAVAETQGRGRQSALSILMLDGQSWQVGGLH